MPLDSRDCDSRRVVHLAVVGMLRAVFICHADDLPRHQQCEDVCGPAERPVDRRRCHHRPSSMPDDVAHSLERAPYSIGDPSDSICIHNTALNSSISVVSISFLVSSQLSCVIEGSFRHCSWIVFLIPAPTPHT